MLKWEKGYCCRKCGHTKSQIRKDFSRTCNICSDTESPTFGKLFHRVKFGLRKAFFICFQLSILHTMIHQVKTWLRMTYSWISEFNINRYLNEFIFRINHS